MTAICTTERTGSHSIERSNLMANALSPVSVVIKTDIRTHKTSASITADGVTITSKQDPTLLYLVEMVRQKVQPSTIRAITQRGYNIETFELPVCASREDVSRETIAN